jgi:carbamoyl-phosphate synthase small subunit
MSISDNTQKTIALLKLKNNHTFVGKSIGQNKSFRYGECVFTTATTGYTESLTDPSYAGQILCFAQPLIGNYGVSKDWMESPKMFAEGVIVSSLSEISYHTEQNFSLDEFILKQNRSGISNIDTRELVKILRNEGNQASILVVDTEEKINTIKDKNFEELCTMVDNPEDINFLNWPKRVNESNINYEDQLYKIQQDNKKKKEKLVILIDCGIKANIIRELSKRTNIKILPADTDIDTILSFKPDGVLLSNGPGDPRDYNYIISTVKELLKTDIPIMGICLGHQILSLAIDAKVYKMKFGNRGANQPVQDLVTKKAYLTSQNHGYAVDNLSLPDNYQTYFTNLNDNSVEGIIHKTKPIFSVQFHPEACGGPQDTNWLFDKFVNSL